MVSKAGAEDQQKSIHAAGFVQIPSCLGVRWHFHLSHLQGGEESIHRSNGIIPLDRMVCRRVSLDTDSAYILPNIHADWGVDLQRVIGRTVVGNDPCSARLPVSRRTCQGFLFGKGFNVFVGQRDRSINWETSVVSSR